MAKSSLYQNILNRSKTNKVVKITKLILFVLVLNVSSCQDNPSAAETKKIIPEYVPLAVGNVWEYSYSIVGTQTTPNGTNQISSSKTIVLRILSTQKVNDTLETFRLATIETQRDYWGGLQKDSSVINLYRTPTRIYPFFGFGLQRTVSDSILKGDKVVDKIRLDYFVMNIEF
jgi:hypothetical protein